ncbi:MAG: site-specific tyrosine recombinase XerD [Pseudomonadota bacterium]|jgi:integrase/recombinase XerD
MDKSTQNPKSAGLLDLQISGFPETLKARGKQPSTVESYTRDADRFLEFMKEKKIPVRDLRPEILLEYENYLRNDREGRTNSVRRSLIGIRQYFRYLVEQKQLRESPFDTVPLPARDEGLPDQLDEEDVAMLMEAAAATTPTIKAARDRAVVALLAWEGIKATELIHLTWSDLILDGSVGLSGRPSSGGSLSVPGDRGRTIVLGPETASILEAYREMFREWSARRPGVVTRMFISFKGRESAIATPTMTRHGLKFVMYELGEKIGISKLNSELLRHHAIRHQLSLGKSPEDLMGHLGLRRLGNIARHNAHVMVNPAPRKELEGMAGGLPTGSGSDDEFENNP